MSFIRDLRRRGYVLVISSIHREERFKPYTRSAILRLLSRYDVTVCNVDVEAVRAEAENYLSRYKLSYSRLLDVMHLVVARRCGCKYIAAIDRFIRSHSRGFGLTYINYYTGIP